MPSYFQIGYVAKTRAGVCARIGDNKTAAGFLERQTALKLDKTKYVKLNVGHYLE